MSNVLVTGATGFLGEYLVRRLVKEGFQVFALGRNAERGKVLEQQGAVFCPGDFTNRKQCELYIQGMDYVIHAGALSTVWGSWKDFYNTNVAGTRLVGELCLKHQVKRLVYISSPSIYTGKQDRYLIKEAEYDKSNQLNYYIKSKIMAEQQLQLLSEHGLETVILRPRGLIGVGDTSLVPRLLRANGKTGIPLFRQGRNMVDLTSVENVALACQLALTAEGAAGQTFNITNGEPTEFRVLLEAFLAAIGEKPRYRALPFPLMYGAAAGLETLYHILHLPGEPPLTRYTVCTLGYAQTMDITKAEKLLGYYPEKTLAESIREYGRWWKMENNKGQKERQEQQGQQGQSDLEQGPDLVTSVKIYHCGCCINHLNYIFKHMRREKRRFPAAVALINHKKYGCILYDTGYSHKLFGRTPLLWLYRTLNPVALSKAGIIPEKLKQDGIRPGRIKRIILSHGHPDHIGGLTYFKNYQLIATPQVLHSLRRPQLKQLVFPELLPEKGTVRSVKALLQPVTGHFLQDYFDTVYDIFGDGSVYGVVLEGHSDGQLGLWIPDISLLLAADASWGDDLMSRTGAMRWIARKIQCDYSAYQKTVRRLERLKADYPGIQIVFSHQQGEECIYGKSSAGS